MNTNKAIKILSVQREKLIEKKIYKDENWVFQTTSYIKEFFGEHSPEYKFISKYTFAALVHNYMSKEEILSALKEKKDKALIYIDNCIETIQNRGLYKPQKNSFLKRISNTAIWTIICFAIPGLLSLGFHFGQFITDTKNIELKMQVKQLQDSLHFAKSKKIIPEKIKANDAIIETNKIK